MGNEEKLLFDSFYIFKTNNPSSEAYNGVKNVSIFVCCFFDCKVFSRSTLYLSRWLRSFPKKNTVFKQLKNCKYIRPWRSFRKSRFFTTLFAIVIRGDVSTSAIETQWLLYIFQKVMIFSAINSSFFTKYNCDVITM